MIIPVSFPNKSELSLAYMSIIKGGGLFIRGDFTNHLGKLVKLQLTLAYKNEQLLAEGKIVWITPRGAQNGMVPGIGVQFCGSKSELVQRKLEQELSKLISNHCDSYTF